MHCRHGVWKIGFRQFRFPKSSYYGPSRCLVYKVGSPDDTWDLVCKLSFLLSYSYLSKWVSKYTLYRPLVKRTEVHNGIWCLVTLSCKMAVNDWTFGARISELFTNRVDMILFWQRQTKIKILSACLDGAGVSASGLKIGRYPVQISPKTNFSIMIK